MIVLGIETSCDETGVALYGNEAGLIAHGLYSQVAVHAEFGGVVPELASRDHVRKLAPMVRNLLDEAGLGLADLGGVAYTAGPGLAGALLVGASVARSLAHGLGIPAVGVHHMEGHLLAPMLEDDPPAFPFLALLVSGGHTLLVEVDGVGEYKVLGESVDDAAGEAFDKTAKLLGLPYPGGPALAALAASGDPTRFRLPRPMTDRPGLDFSFSGLKTAVMVALREVTGEAGPDATQDHATQDHATRADMARAFEDAVVETLAIKCSRALDATGLDTLIVAGGVGANRALRLSLDQLAAQRGARVHYPRPEFCTDNGAMIAYAGHCRLVAGEFEDERIKVRARWPLAELVPPGDARRAEGTP